MTKQYITVGFFIVIFFAGFAGGYIVSEQIYSPSNLMARDPDTTQRWLEIMLGTMMNSLRDNQQFLNQLNNP